MSEEFDTDNLPDIDLAEVSDRELVKSIDYTRPLKDYATAQTIADFLKARREVKEINLSSLSINGEIVQDDMETYLQNPAYNSGALKEALNLHYIFFLKEKVAGSNNSKRCKRRKHTLASGLSFIHASLNRKDLTRSRLNQKQADQRKKAYAR